MTIPPGMTPEKLDKIADYVSLLDRMEFNLDAQTVTFRGWPGLGEMSLGTDEGLHARETEMQDDLRAWATYLREAP
jgi:hypothetical protein